MLHPAPVCDRLDTHKDAWAGGGKFAHRKKKRSFRDSGLDDHI